MKKHTLLMICSCLFVQLSLHAQNVTYSTANKKTQSLFDQAVDAMRSYQTTKAISLLESAIKQTPNFTDAYGQLGLAQLELKQYPHAIQSFEKLLQLDTAAFKTIGYGYARALAGNGQFPQSLDVITRYVERSKAPSDKALRLKASMEFAAKNSTPVPFTPRNLGDNINSSEAEYFPSITIDDQTLVFTRRVKGTNEDFFVAGRDTTKQWKRAANMGEPINSAFNEGAQNISQDGEMIVFTGCNFPQGKGSCDIYYSVKENGIWSEPRNMGNAINTEGWETQPSLSPDKQTLYFVRGTSDNGYDIYSSTRNSSGVWQEAVPLGNTINTKGNETTPYIHADNQTLFFASDGWPGYGSLDMFYAKRNADGSWGEAKNLGYPINTIEEDASLIVAADGKTAYFSSDRSDSRGALDIYSFELYESARPARTTYVKGYVYDSTTNKRILAAIDLVDLSNGQTIATIRSDNNGHYLVPLPTGKDYAFSVARRGYLFYSDYFSLSGNIDLTKPYEKNIPLQPLAVNAEIVLKNIFFDTKKYELQPASLVELNKLVKLLTDNPGMKIEINGHTDNVGNDADNLKLSQNRAKSVADYLASQGVAANRITAKGFGETKPVADNTTDEGRAQNRRTTLRIVSL
ncbi:WD40 repeat protein [Chitinophaga skermanii]|uniref:WD40 repeat protein n=1 Tax=Chitinophaga skermanii TaxID=331697 RepID=A0A327Q5D5_9BACT|nr:OmpA family protein [Chitinophaga skermanii]RAI98422.1 WD40 repeat protein [Chitinophaga skermanii]